MALKIGNFAVLQTESENILSKSVGVKPGMLPLATAEEITKLTGGRISNIKKYAGPTTPPPSNGGAAAPPPSNGGGAAPPPGGARPPSMFEWLFPPLGMWNLAFGDKDPATGLPAAPPPGQTGGGVGLGTGGVATGGIEGITEKLTGSLGLAATLLPLIIIIPIITSVKGLFK